MTKHPRELLSDLAQRVHDPKRTTDCDKEVGLRIATLRKAKGLSQTDLGQALGVTFQQVQKYEKGQNRIGAGRLRDVAKLFGAPITSFFPDEEEAPAADAAILDFLRTPGAVELLQAFTSIASTSTRQDLVRLARSIAHAPAAQAVPA